MGVLSKFKAMPLKAAVITLATLGVLGGGLAFYNQQVAARNIKVPIPAGRSCNTDAVIYCGMTSLDELQYKVNHGDSLHSAGNIQNILGYFGISKADVASMDTYAVAGKVMKNGDVYVGNEKVAHDAYTGGRWYLKGSKTVTYKGTKFYTRKPTVSFAHNTYTAYVVMKNGKFQFAILAACGNPITAKPYTPNYSIQKDVRVKGTSTWHQDVTVKPGTHVEYRITVKSTGTLAAKDITVKDNKPSNVVYVPNTMKRNGTNISNKRLFVTGDKISSLAPGKSVVYTFEAAVAPKDKVATCKAETLTNVSQINNPALPVKKDTAVVKKNCYPKPVVACVDVTADRVKDNTFSFTAKAKADNAKVTSYVFHFGDGKSATKKTSSKTATVEHTYAKQGQTYKGYVVVNTSVKNGVTSSNCQFEVKTPQPPKPVLTCEGLSVQVGEADLTYNFTARASAKNTKITSYVFHFGDGKSQTVKTSQTSAKASHTYNDNDKTFNAYVEVNGTDQSGVTSSKCHVKVTTPKKPVTPQLLCSELTFAKQEDNTYSFTATASAKNTTVTSFVFDFGDGQTKTVTTSNETATVSHTYANDDQDYSATVTVNGKDVQNVTSANCQVTIPKTPKTPECKPGVPEGSPECQPKECKPGVPEGSKECQPPVTPTPPEMPNTGPGEVIGFFSATSLAGGLIHRLVLRRKATA